LKTADVFSIPCECEKIYIGQIRRLIETKIKEYHRHIRLVLLAFRNATIVSQHPSNYNECSFVKKKSNG